MNNYPWLSQFYAELTVLDSMLPCFVLSGDQTANQLRDRFQPTLTHSLVGDYINRLIDTSLGSHWTRLYDSVCYYNSILASGIDEGRFSINITHSLYYNNLSCCTNGKTRTVAYFGL